MKADPDPAAPRIGGAMITIAWLLVLGLLTLLFSNWLDRQRNPNQELQAMSPDTDSKEIQLKRNRYGHYVATGRINGQRVEFFLDTGATDVSVPSHLSKRLRLKPGPSMPVRTANGIISVRLTKLDRVELGPIVVTDVSANINSYMREDSILLGMSFLKSLEFTQRGDTLTLRQYSSTED